MRLVRWLVLGAVWFIGISYALVIIFLSPRPW
jgi:hypothetical protein